MKQITITVPDNCELKKDGNTYTIVEKEKKLTYEDITKSLFSKPSFFIGVCGIAANNSLGKYATNCTSKKQAEKLLAINKLMNVAKYLNDNWQPDWDDEEESKYYVPLDNIHNYLFIDCAKQFQRNDVYFKSKELAEQAIEILGEETIKLTFCTDY